MNGLKFAVPARLQQFHDFHSELCASRIDAAVQDALARVNEQNFLDFFIKLHDHLANCVELTVKIRHDLQHEVTRRSHAFSLVVVEKELEMLDVIVEDTVDKPRFYVLWELLEEFVSLEVKARRILNRFFDALFAQVYVALGQFF